MSDGYGQFRPNDGTADFNALNFIITQKLARVRTIILAKVVAVTSAGEVAEAGLIDVQPITNMVDGDNNASQHGVIHNILYERVQGGLNAIIMDPQVGDIGRVAICDRDISANKAVRGIANPGSYRRFSFSDGVYLGGVLNGVPNQYVQFNDLGIAIVDKNGNSVVMNADGITITDCNGNIIDMSAAAIATTGLLKNNGKAVGSTHTHSGVTTGSGDTGVPV